jgi:hypothetical protein
MRDRRLDKADGLADEARRLSAAGDHAGAERLHRQAIALCREVYAEQELDAEDGVADPVEQGVAAHALADHLGRLGGSLRRADRLDASLRAYNEGAELERRWRLDDTYNRTNAITLTVELRPERIPTLERDVEEVLRILRRQVEGSRRGQWWAWSDLGLLSLLIGRQADADWAYDRYLDCKPRKVDITSTVDILHRLHRAVEPIQPDQAAAVGAAAERLEAAMVR